MSEILQGFLEGLLGTDRINALQQLGVIASRVILALVIVLATLIVAARIRDAIQRSVGRARPDPSLGILLGRVGFVGALVVGAMLVLRELGLEATTLVALVGVASLAISLALQDVLRNIFAGTYLLIERPFRPGETIKVRDFVGVVLSVDLRTTTLQGDGELIHVPNAILFAEVLINRGIRPAAPKEPVE